MTLSTDNTVQSPVKLRAAAMDLLGRREYSLAELREKLTRRFGPQPVLEQVLAELQEDNLQSDQRFTESFVRSRVSRGQGLQRIRLDIRQRGIADELLAQALEILDIDWFQQAREVAERKFGSRAVVDQKDRARRMRFLQYRGFSFDQINYALTVSGDD